MTPSNIYQGLLTFEKQGKVHLFWRSTRSSTPGIFSVESSNGKNFKKSSGAVSFFRVDGTKLALGSAPILRASMVGTKTVLSFVNSQKEVLFVAPTRGGSWKVIATPVELHGPTVCLKLPAKGGKKSRIIAFSARGMRVISQGSSLRDLEQLKDAGDVLEARRQGFDTTALLPLWTELIPQGILLVYSAKNTLGRLTVGAAIFDRERPKTLLWRSDVPLFEVPAHVASDAALIGGARVGKYFFVYLQSPGKVVECFPMARYWEAVQKNKRHDFVLPPRKKGVMIRLERLEANPVLEPIAKHAWEAFATFNPAAITLDGRVHLLYRAQGYDGLSVLGYAVSQDGIHIDERLTDPAFVPSRAIDTKEGRYPYVSGGGTGGCEDPRLVEIDGVVYLMYIAFDGAHPPGIALSHISKANFLARKWRWARPKLISQPGQIQKNWVLFPKKINGKYVILHGLSPTIRLEYVDDLKKLGNGKYIESLSSHGGQGYVEARRLRAWDNIVRGVGAPPLWTEHGWLVFYHGMDMRDPGKYKVGVMLLDLKHPDIILRRSLEPVLEPETSYENGGHKRGVVYVCGAVIKDGKLFVYYGAADRTSAVAMADLDTFLQSLLKEEAPVLKKMNTKKIS
ncbi:MAG: hypothetical protein Q8O53_03360 [Candidatus Moranbacteria bacterium]|nr:hypothetical protein [Candidatus Moranbacteria bacterium]